FKLSEFRFDMRESAFQHREVTAHVRSLHFSNDASPFEQQPFLAFELFELLIGQGAFGASFPGGFGSADLIFNGFAFPSSRHLSYCLPAGIAGMFISLKSAGTMNRESSRDFRSTLVASMVIAATPSSFSIVSLRGNAPPSRSLTHSGCEAASARSVGLNARFLNALRPPPDWPPIPK